MNRMTRRRGNRYAIGRNSYLTCHLLLHATMGPKKLAVICIDRYFFVPTSYLYNRASDAVKRTQFFNSLVVKYQTLNAISTGRNSGWK